MSCLIVGSEEESEEENEEESNQICLGPETLGRWQQNGCVEKTKGRERFKQSYWVQAGMHVYSTSRVSPAGKKYNSEKKKKKKEKKYNSILGCSHTGFTFPRALRDSTSFFSLLSYPKTPSKHSAAPGSGPSSVSFCPQDNASCFNCT